MKSPKSKLALFAVGIALLSATPVFAQQAPRLVQSQQYQVPILTHPRLVDRGTEAYAPQDVPGYGKIGITSAQ